MSSEFFFGAAPVHVQPQKPLVQPPDLAQPPADKIEVRAVEPGPSAVTESPSPDRVQAVDAVFSHYSEHSGLADLVGFFAGAMLLGDLVNETAREGPDLFPPEEEEPEKKD